MCTMGPSANDLASHRVLFVCLGNICRSPMAQAVLTHKVAALIPGRVEVDSAGTGPWHVGSPADTRAMDALRDKGYALNHRARQVSDSWLAQRDLVIAMDLQNRAHLRAMAPSHDAPRIHLFRSWDPELAHVDPEGPDAHLLEVPDPYYGTPQDYRTVLAMLERAADGLISHLTR
jgi:protein-tyrosine phosphatase